MNSESKPKKYSPSFKGEVDNKKSFPKDSPAAMDRFVASRKDESKKVRRVPAAVAKDLALGKSKAADTAWEASGPGHAPSKKVFGGSK